MRCCLIAQSQVGLSVHEQVMHETNMYKLIDVYWNMRSKRDTELDPTA